MEYSKSLSAEVQKTLTEQMSLQEIADAIGVSKDTIRNCVRRIFPDKMQQGKTAYFSAQEVACISKELKNNAYVTEKLTSEAASQVKESTTELEIIGNAISAFKDLQKLYQQKEAEYKNIIESKDKQLFEQQPKIEVYDAICDSSTLQDLQTVAVTINLKNIFKVLKADGILEEKYAQDGQRYYKPMAKYSEYLVLKDGKAWKDKDGVSHIRPRVFVTGKGLVWLSKKYKDA